MRAKAEPAWPLGKELESWISFWAVNAAAKELGAPDFNSLQCTGLERGKLGLKTKLTKIPEPIIITNKG